MNEKKKVNCSELNDQVHCHSCHMRHDLSLFDDTRIIESHSHYMHICCRVDAFRANLYLNKLEKSEEEIIFNRVRNREILREVLKTIDEECKDILQSAVEANNLDDYICYGLSCFVSAFKSIIEALNKSNDSWSLAMRIETILKAVEYTAVNDQDFFKKSISKLGEGIK